MDLRACGGPKVLIILLTAAMISACGPNKISKKVYGSCSNRISVAYTGVNERAYCTIRNMTYSPAAVIDGYARYEARSYGVSGLSTTPLPDINNPIRYAEVVVYNEKNEIVQCTETDGSGYYTFPLPVANASYTLKVYSRGYNASVKASVLNCPEEEIPYFISTNVIPDTSKTLSTIKATAENSGPMLGAAFSIFDQIVNANNFMKAQVGTCSISGCTNFAVTEKVQIYWDKGFNPNAYYSSPYGGSYYIPGYHRLFILGGIDGDIYTSDTDHFDNSVILHEYGHFMEDVYGVSDSPGGSHYSDSVIDPRLAWSEAWGDFIQGAIRSEGRYRDTEGTYDATVSGSFTTYMFNINLETYPGSCTSSNGCDNPVFAQEGNFREFSIARMLWDVFDSGSESGVTDNVDNDFSEIWHTMTSAQAFLNPNWAFRNVGHLHLFQSTTFGSSAWSTLRTNHKQGEIDEFGKYVKADPLVSCGQAYEIDPYNDPNDDGTFETSHLLRNNDFYYFKYDGTGPFQLTLTAKTIDVSGGYATEHEPDLDLYLYYENGMYGHYSDMAGYAAHSSDNDPNTSQTEAITKSSLPKGKYLINVKVNTKTLQAGDNTRYQLKLNSGVDLCPSSLP